MFRNKLLILLSLLLPLASASAESTSLISQDLIQTETVNYSKTAVVESGNYERTHNTSASEFYPYLFTVAAEVNNAYFLQYHVTRGQQVKEGDLLATFTLDVDEAACAAARLSLERAQKDYEQGKQDRNEQIADLLEKHSSSADPYEREVLVLQLKRAQTALEQYCYQQECNLQQLNENLAELEEANSGSQLYAPSDGVIESVTYKREGEKIYAGERLITMYREDGMLLAISNDQLYFRYGMPVTVSAGSKSDPRIYQGQVVAADDLLPQSRRLGYAFIQLEPFEEGETPRLNRLTVSGVSQKLQNVLLLPRRALTMSGGKYYVECLVNGSLQKRFVNVGLAGMSEAWVIQGLEPGDIVVMD